MIMPWRDIRTVKDLAQFSLEYELLPESIRSRIRGEMLKCIDDYAAEIKEVPEKKPPQAEKLVSRPRRMRSRRS